MEMSNIIAQYYQGITQRLRSEVDSINTLFHHQGVKGEGNETVLRDLITQFIPKRYGVGTGVVIDRFGNQSRQCDIVIYDTFHYPSLLSLATVHLFPIDIVYATIEVKTTLDSGSAQEALNNIASVRNLHFIPDQFVGTVTRSGAFRVVGHIPDPPQGYIFAYNSETSKFETYKKWFAPKSEQPSASSPILVGCLDQGLLMFTNNDNEIGIRPEEGMRLKGWMLPLQDEKGDSIELPIAHESYTQGNIVFPVKKLGQKYVVIDQSRVLLLFLLALQEILSRKVINPDISFLNQYFADYAINSRYEV